MQVHKVVRSLPAILLAMAQRGDLGHRTILARLNKDVTVLVESPGRCLEMKVLRMGTLVRLWSITQEGVVRISGDHDTRQKMTYVKVGGSHTLNPGALWTLFFDLRIDSISTAFTK